MSDLFGQSAPTTTYDAPGYESPAAEPAAGRVGKVQIEEPRRHPLTYAALGLALLALLLSIIALAQRSGGDVNRVRVGNNDCVSVKQDTGPAALYCRTAGLPTG